MPIPSFWIAVGIACLFAAMLLWRKFKARTPARVDSRRLSFDERANGPEDVTERLFRLGRLSLNNPPDDSKR
ncbi:MAG: hypothetical protein ACXW2U_08745 [Telluria sp.]